MIRTWFYNPLTGEKRLFLDGDQAPPNWLFYENDSGIPENSINKSSVVVESENGSSVPVFRVETVLVIWEPYFILLVLGFFLLLFLG